MRKLYSMWLVLITAALIAWAPASGFDGGSSAGSDPGEPGSGQNSGERSPVVDHSAAATAATSPEHATKVALIKELLVASRADRNAQLGYDTVVSQEMHGLQVALNDRIDKDPKLTAGQKFEAKRLLLIRLNKRMKRAKELMQQKLDLQQLVGNCYIKLYDKYFTTQEIKDMLAWYKTATAQKLLDALPDLTKEMMQLVNAALLPKLKEMDEQLSAEDAEGRFNP